MPLFSGHVCKTKWNNLRNSYVRYVRELKKIPSGAAQKKKKWHLADAMTFLDNVVGPTRKMTSSLVITTEPGENDNNSNDVINEELAQQPLIKDDGMEFIPHRKQRKTAAEIVAAPMAEFLKVATEKRKADETEDPMLTFLKACCPRRNICLIKESGNLKRQ